MNYLIKLLLLVVMSFSITHGVVFDMHEDEHCSVQEFVAEFSHPIQHDLNEHDGDLCNSHFMLHLPFLLPSYFTLAELSPQYLLYQFKLPISTYSHVNNTFRPPIV